MSKPKINPVNWDNEYAIGYTKNGDEFWFDKEDYDKIKGYCWYYSHKGYVVAKERKTRKQISLHNVIMGLTSKDFENGIVVDHKNHPPGNEHKKDNRKSNLEIVTLSENMQNRTLNKNNTSGVSGVHWNKNENKWQVRIGVKGKRIQIGYFVNLEDAIRARKDAEYKYYGEHRHDAYNS